MGQLWLPEYEVCTKQPQRAVTINKDNTITESLVSSILVSSQVNMVTGKALFVAGGKPQSTPFGIGTPTITSESFILEDSSPVLSGKILNELTIVAIVYSTGASSNPASSIQCLAGADTSEYGTSIVQQQYGTNGIRAGAYYHPNYNGRLNIVVSNVFVPGLNVIVFRYRRNAVCDLLVNNVVVGTATSSDLAVKFDAAGSSNVNRISKAAGVTAAYNALGNAIFSRYLSDAEVASISENPWQLFRQKRDLPFNITAKEDRKPVLKESTMLGTSKRVLSNVEYLNTKANKNFLELDRNNHFSSSIEIVVTPSHALSKNGRLEVYPYSNQTSITSENGVQTYRTTNTTGIAGLSVRNYTSSLYMGNGEKGFSALILYITPIAFSASNPCLLGAAASNGCSYGSDGKARIIASSTTAILNPTVMQTDTLYILSYGWRYGTGDCYVGVNENFTVSSNRASGNSGVPVTTFGHSSTSGFTHNMDRVALTILFDRLLTVDEAKALAANPLQIFKKYSPVVLPK